MIVVFFGCEKKDTEFKNFLNGHEVVYPGKVLNISSRPGKNRVALLWNPSPDPSVSKYVIYWNNKADSMVVNATTHNTSDTVRAIIPNLQEYVYSFTVISKDSAGNKSVPQEINNVKVYGDVYNSSLLNRPYNGTNPYEVNLSDGSVKLFFNTPDTINISTSVKYTNTSGATLEKLLMPIDNSIVLPNYKPGTEIFYKSSYIPGSGAIDTFYVANYDTFPQIFVNVQCDKSLFSEVHLPNDEGTYESGTSISKLWDGSVGPQGYPNIFHSNGDHMAHTITMDMGKVYNNLSQFEEVGRNCCNNPDKFEIWGINDISNAATTLPANDAGWKAESISKGWTLLKDAIRTDDGVNAMKFNMIDNPPPVRYIRVRIKHVVTGSNYSNLSELTFWNRE
jgi:hypothetical protein